MLSPENFLDQNIALEGKVLEQVTLVTELRDRIKAARLAGKKVAFVPTMGNLHEGHLSLIDEAKSHGDFIVASIFVNPMQFGENEDLDAYPRTLEADKEGLAAHGCDLLFTPTVSEMYPHGLRVETRVEVPELSKLHCGASRPGHFVGVATVVAKLFNLVQPDIAVFGEKDFQQLAVIRKLVADLCFPIDIIGVATAREPSGLAKSSRNGYLTKDERVQASGLYKILQDCKAQLSRGEKIDSTRSNAVSALEAEGFKLDYLNFANPLSLEMATEQDEEIVILLAAFLGSTRLIDNIVVNRGQS